MFAFGMLLVSMLTSEAPWAGRSGPQIVLAAGILRVAHRPLPARGADRAPYIRDGCCGGARAADRDGRAGPSAGRVLSFTRAY